MSSHAGSQNLPFFAPSCLRSTYATPLKSDPLAFAAELRPQTASIVVDQNTIQRPQPATFRCQRIGRADIDL
jgi:1,4-alpha-glucan branching enzyme